MYYIVFVVAMPVDGHHQHQPPRPNSTLHHGAGRAREPMLEKRSGHAIGQLRSAAPMPTMPLLEHDVPRPIAGLARY